MLQTIKLLFSQDKIQHTSKSRQFDAFNAMNIATASYYTIVVVWRESGFQLYALRGHSSLYVQHTAQKVANK